MVPSERQSLPAPTEGWRFGAPAQVCLLPHTSCSSFLLQGSRKAPCCRISVLKLQLCVTISTTYGALRRFLLRRKTMKILISGSTGLVGSALVPAVRSNRHEVIALVRSSSSAQS